MVVGAANFDGFHFVGAGDAAEEGPEAVAQFGSDLRPTFFCAEYAMEIGADVGHGKDFSRPFGTRATTNRGLRR